MMYRIPGSFALGVAAAGVLLVVLASPVAAESTPCPIASDGTVSGAVGLPVSGSVVTNFGGMTLCSYSNESASGRAFGVSHEMNAFGPSEGGAAALAQRYVPGLPDTARTQIDALSQAGINVVDPNYELESVGGMGDAALWVKIQLVPGFFKDSLLVQRGSDGFAFDVDDSPDARAELTALAQAVLAQV
jgi:hypothetical protein